MGPIGVKSHLEPFLPSSHHYTRKTDQETGITQVSSAQWGSASILPISWMYLRTLGSIGVRESTTHAILNANYIRKRLENAYNIVY